MKYEYRLIHARILDYKHGTEISRTTPFQRLHIRNLYGRNCVLCGKSELFNYQELSLHHIENQYSHGDGQPWLLALLCEECHHKVHEPSLDSHLKTLLLLKAFELAYDEEPWSGGADCIYIPVDKVQFKSEPLLV